MSKQKYVMQTYKERRKIYPYEETTAYYFGPKLDFTKEIKDNSRKKNYGIVQKNATRR
jgi:hypothetical protein